MEMRRAVVRGRRALRDPGDALRRLRMRVRGYPTPDDFDRMGRAEMDAYMRRIGVDERIAAAIAASDAHAPADTEPVVPGR